MGNIAALTPARTTSTVLAIAFSALGAGGRALGACSPSALDEVRMELRATAPPDCGPKALRRAFARTCDKAALVTERAVVQCASARTPRIARAHKMLMGLRARLSKPGMARRLDAPCDATYRTEIERLDADLGAAANGTETTTTTSPPGVPTTTTEPECTTVTLEVDKGDCTRVTSEPPRFVECGAACDVRTFVVPASGSLQLKGTPAPGDSGASFGGDCDDDGTVPLGDASPPDCSLSCDCSSDP
jgi:hypothetical protein